MNNFQLYKSNVLLGGQLKWDIIINSHSSKLYVDDFHLSPISDSIPFIHKTDDNLVYNKHQDNVKAYYNANMGHFYNEGLSPEFMHNWPLINYDNTTLTAYSNTYDMGCRRSRRFKEFNKQFEFLCPVWIEHLDDEISFKISVKNSSSSTILASNVLKLSLNGHSFHDRFVQYFKDYIKYINIDKGDDRLLYVKFKEKTANIHGLNVSNGLVQTLPIDSLVDNLTSRERPLLEVDNLLMESFMNSKFICKQLFNFNLCFNINDILSGSIINMMLGEDVIITVDVFVGGKQLEKRDFYTNYEHIDKYVWAINHTDFSDNVLNYLHDNECVDLINKNKFCQSICHWSLSENPEYLFNVYDGFSGLFVEQDPDTNEDIAIYENEHQYCNASNTFIKKADYSQNTTGWSNIVSIRKWNTFYKYISNTGKNKKDGTYIYDTNFINNIKYNYLPNVDGLTFADQKGCYLLKMLVTNKLLSTITNSFNCIDLYNGSLYFLYNEDLLIFLTNDENYFSYGLFYDVLYNFVNSTDMYNGLYDTVASTYLREIYKMMSSKVDPAIVVFDSSLKYNNASSPSADTTEVNYFKDNNAFNYVVRYDGLIKPTFVTNSNSLYYKDYVSTRLKNSVYASYGKDGHEPLYPSIGFCAIKRLDDWSYESLPQVKVTEYDDPVAIYAHTYEYPWFANSKCIILDDEMHFTYVCKRQDDGSYKMIDDIVYEVIGTYYNIADHGLIAYIKSLYEYENDWEYYSNTNVDDYIYNITLNLK